MGAILAGGAARRFDGAPKGLARVGADRIIDRVAAALRPHIDRLLVVSRDHAAAGWLEDAVVVTDLHQQRASLVGIHAALHHARGDVLVVAWDMPNVTAELLGLLVARREETDHAVVPTHGTTIEACCALYRPAALAVAAAQLGQGDVALHRFVAALPEHSRVPEDALREISDPARLFANVNSADDLRRVEPGPTTF